MPGESLNASVSGAQPLLQKSCVDCGSVVFGRTKHRQCCVPCREVRRLTKWRKAADVQRRKSGIPKVMGETFSCQECRNKFVATSKSRAKFCEHCRGIVALKRSRFHSKSRTANDARRCRYNKWYKEWVKSTPEVSISKSMRTLMARSLKTGKGGKPWASLVGYNVHDLKAHLERQFIEGMNWENRSEWHIDHIVPLASFRFSTVNDPEFRAAWALTNLRPLWAGDNVSKQAKRIFLI